MTRPLIALTSQFDLKKDRSFVYADYYRSIQRAGGVSYVLPMLIEEADVSRALEPAAGILFVGSDDIHPICYDQQEIHEKTDIEAPGKTRTDFAALKTALTRGLPIFAVCGGMQLLNVFFGGSLHQHIPDIAGAIVHRSGDPQNPAFHAIRVGDEQLSELIRGRRTEVNSYHHQCIDRLADELRVAAVAPDDIVEAVRIRDYRFGLGVQWHPEKISRRPEQAALFSAFIDATRE